MKAIKPTRDGFALIEVLIALSILSIVILSVYSAVGNGIMVLRGSANHVRAMMIARSMVNQFSLDRMRGTDLDRVAVSGHEGFFFSRRTERYEHPLLAMIPARKAWFTVTWTEMGREKNYTIEMVFYQ